MCKKMFHAIFVDESGVSTLEYAFIATLICIAIVASILSVGEQTVTLFEATDNAFGQE
jgi:Flp pilus assembly pilin Flp